MKQKVLSEHKIRILVVEDELIIAKGIEKRLVTMGYEVMDTVATGNEAVTCALENLPDLVLMDICLQGEMDGVKAAENIRSQADIPVIYLTAYADMDTLARAKITEPFGYIVKPFQDVTLKSSIEMALYKHMMESRLKRSERLLSIKNQIASIFLTVPDEEMYGEVLAVIQETMESDYGLFGYIDDDGNLAIPSLVGGVWEECHMSGKSTCFPRSIWGGLWGRAIIEGKTFLSNEPLKVPDGHVDIENFLGVPILYRGEAIGLIAVANRAGSYGEKDREMLESIVDRITPILAARLQRDREERERLRAEEALRQSESRLRSVFQAVPDLISILDKDLRVILSNWGGGYDYVPEEVRNRCPHCYEAYYGIDTPCEPCHAIEVFKTGKLVHREKFNPNIGMMEIYSNPIFDESGNIEYVVETVRDITERKRAEEALAAEKERLAVTLRSIGDGVITTDMEGRIVLLNKAAEEITGWSQEEAAGKPFDQVFKILNEKTRQPCQSPIKSVLSTGSAVELENNAFLISRDGRERIIADSGAPIYDPNSRIIGAVLVFRDVTEKKKMEQELLKARQLESIGVLAGGIAHDFNNLLTAILGNISLAKLFSSGNEKLQSKLAEAENASFRARDLTQQLLTFSRGGAPVKKAALIQDIIRDSTSFTLSGSRTTCCFDIENDLWPVILDSGQISQVINNLIINADQAMPDGGVIDVTCRNVLVETENNLPINNGKYILVSIRDHGVGIPPESIGRIFEPYFTTKEKGKGLGLATVYSIIRNHDGFISASSKPGEGTTFSFYLPCAERNEASSVQEKTISTESVEPACGGKVLVMDDEENIREVAGEMLDFLGYEAEFANDGAEAVEKYKKALASSQPYTAVIMDLTVPGGMGGREAMAILKELDGDIRGIASSGYSNDPIMSDYSSFGFRGIIVKPYQLDEFRKIIKAVLDEG